MAPGACVLEIILGKTYSHQPLIVREATILNPDAQRDYRPAEDYLFVRKDVWDDFRVLLLQKESDQTSNSLSWIADVKYLALEASHARPDRSQTLALALPSIPGLATISFVFPQSSGKMNVDKPVKINERQLSRPVLRKLSKKEVEALWVEVKDSYDSWVGVHPVHWETNAASFLNQSLDSLKKEVKSKLFEHPPACWDTKTRKLKLTFEPVYLIGSGGGMVDYIVSWWR